MGDDDYTYQEGEVSEVTDEVLELDQAALERMIDERANARAQELLAERAVDDEARDMELSRLRARDREVTVRDEIARHQARGVPTAVLRVAAEMMLADEHQESVLNLSREGDSVVLSASDIVKEMLAAIPESSLHLGNPKVPKNLGVAPDAEDDRTAREKAEELLKDLREGETLSVGPMAY